MSEETRTDTGTGELAPMPEPQIEPGEPAPGGSDAIDDQGDRIIPDLTPEENPAIDDKTPDDLQEQMSGAEDTSTEATESSSEDAGAQEQGSAEQGKAE